MDLVTLLRTTVGAGGSDLHLQVGSTPAVRVKGVLRPLDADPVTAEQMQSLVHDMTPEKVQQRLHDARAADFGFAVESLGRFRVAVFYQLGQPAMVFRVIPTRIASVDELSLPAVMTEIASAERGLVLLTGTTGSGKSTSLAAMIDHINQTRRRRIITVEDPIEFVHTPAKCMIAHREVGDDAVGFLPSLREALRQDPDVILIGELRDHETMRTALQAADTGHLVFSTIHTTTASQTVQRMIALFPPEERELLLMQLATNLEAVISQRLAVRADGNGRVPVVEVLRNTPVVKKLITEGRLTALPSAIASRDNGMQMFDQHLGDLYNEQVISGTEAIRLATNAEAVSLAMRGISTADTSAGLVR